MTQESKILTKSHFWFGLISFGFLTGVAWGVLTQRVNTCLEQIIIVDSKIQRHIEKDTFMSSFRYEPNGYKD